MSVKEIIKKSRSYRRFDESSMDIDKLYDMVSVVRNTPSAGNLQNLRYILSTDKDKNSEIFTTLKWAGYLKDWESPCEGERPSGYIVIVTEKISSPNTWFDVGIASQSIILNLVENGYSGTIFLAIDKERLKSLLKTDLEIITVIAVGKPIENVEIVDCKEGDIKYYRDDKGNHFVPKRSLEELIIEKY